MHNSYGKIRNSNLSLVRDHRNKKYVTLKQGRSLTPENILAAMYCNSSILMSIPLTELGSKCPLV